jgi:hypothetical protein
MGPSATPDCFYIYLWRSPHLPGALYLANGFPTAEALCRGLAEDGYTVKVIHSSSDTEFELREGRLHPTSDSSAEVLGQSARKSSSQGTSPAFA